MGAGGPHQEAEGLLQPFAGCFFGGQELLQLGLQLRQFMLGEADRVGV